LQHGCLRRGTFLPPSKKVPKEVGLGGGVELTCSRNQSHPPPKNPLPARTFVTRVLDSTAVFALSHTPFAVLFKADSLNLGLSGEGEISVVNLKCDTRLIGSFREEPGFFPGWHMNKAHWISVALDGTVEDEKIRFLVDMSYELTK